MILHIEDTAPGDTVCDQAPDTPEAVITEAVAKADGSARYFVYILGADNDPDVNAFLTGFQLGISYDENQGGNNGLAILDWQHCSDLEWPRDDWPQSGSGNTITWAVDACQTDRIAVAGYFYLSAYTPSIMAIIPFPVTGVVKVANCYGAESPLETVVPMSAVGWVSMGGAAVGTDSDGCNPILETCTGVNQTTPVEPITWGRLKTLFKH